MDQFYSGQEILITGGTGSLGQTLTRQFLSSNYKLKGLRLLSRGEEAQWKFRNSLIADGLLKNSHVEFLIGDVRDKSRLDVAMRGVDIVFHTAALKHIPIGERNPIEVIQTNIIGTQNVLLSAIENKVNRALLVSTDKAVAALNLYGMTKAVAEKLFIHGNVYSGGRPPLFSCCRYGNVLGSKGSIVPLFRKQKESGKITITDREMTRFWISLPQVASFLIERCRCMKGEEIFIPKMPSSTILDIASIIAPDAEIVDIGIRPGEKLHECLLTVEEGKDTVVHKNYYEIRPQSSIRSQGFTYVSNLNPWKLTKEDLFKMIEEVPTL